MKEVSEENITPIDVEEPDYNTISDDQHKKIKRMKTIFQILFIKLFILLEYPLRILKAHAIYDHCRSHEYTRFNRQCSVSYKTIKTIRIYIGKYTILKIDDVTLPNHFSTYTFL